MINETEKTKPFYENNLGNGFFVGARKTFKWICSRCGLTAFTVGRAGPVVDVDCIDDDPHDWDFQGEAEDD